MAASQRASAALDVSRRTRQSWVHGAVPRVQSAKHLKQYLWAIVGALLVTWLLAYASISYQDAAHNPTVYHYKYKVCPAPTQGFSGR